MSLSYWFRDYLYISLGGNRISKSRTYLNLFIVFLATGLWHGASWNFVVWGLFHGFFIIVEHAGLSKVLKKAPGFITHPYTLLVWVVSMVLFRSPDLPSSLDFLGRMFVYHEGNSAVTAYHQNFFLDFETYVLLFIAVLFSIPTYSFVEKKLEALMNKRPQYNLLLQGLKLVLFASMFIISASYIAAGSYNPFIYFRF
jgi:alginate O-acetyltransferase complex protein AlgI